VGEEEEGKLKLLGAVFLVVLRHFDMVFSTDACAVQCGSAIRARSIANRLEFDSEPYLSFFLSFFFPFLWNKHKRRRLGFGFRGRYRYREWQKGRNPTGHIYACTRRGG
jgi:hypothetical protein